ARVGARAERRVLREDLAELRAAEVGVDREPRPFANHGLVTGRPERVAERRGDPALPDDRVGDRAAGRPVPDDRGLPLLRAADRGDPLDAARDLYRLARRRKLGLPDRLGVVAHVA